MFPFPISKHNGSYDVRLPTKRALANSVDGSHIDAQNATEGATTSLRHISGSANGY